MTSPQAKCGALQGLVKNPRAIREFESSNESLMDWIVSNMYWPHYTPLIYLEPGAKWLLALLAHTHLKMQLWARDKASLLKLQAKASDLPDQHLCQAAFIVRIGEQMTLAAHLRSKVWGLGMDNGGMPTTFIRAYSRMCD